MTHTHENIPTPHIAAAKTDIAETVLFPGDPLRAQYIAEHFLESSRQVTDVRGMLGFTGKFNKKDITIMGSGMGGPSAGLYSYELFAFYDVQQIVRIGTSGGFSEDLEPGDLILAMTASTDSHYAYQYELPGTFSPAADFDMLQKAAVYADAHQFRYQAGALFSSDMFSSYNARGPEKAWRPWARLGCLGQDMETYALYCNAAYLHKKALSIVTMVASCSTGKGITADKGMQALHPMIETALSLL
jgi:purine-nucleoside phosphorylase